jgi:hypothetical protein
MPHCCHQHARLVLMGRALHTADWVWTLGPRHYLACWLSQQARCQGGAHVEATATEAKEEEKEEEEATEEE